MSRSKKSERFRTLRSLLLELAQERSLDALLTRIVRGLREEPDVALARIWLLLPGDICDRCHFRKECPDRTQCLHLVASAGNPLGKSKGWNRLDGRFRRFPLGIRKVGHIAATGESVEVTEIDEGSHWIANPAWAIQESIHGFVGEPIIFRGEMIGVLGVFLRVPVIQESAFWLRMLADHAAAAITNARAFQEIERLRAQLELENTYLCDEVKEAHEFGEIIGRSPALRKVLEQVELVAPIDTSVLILGESGSGKELFARAIHEHSPRREHPLIKVNCASIPHELFESEFFGHVKGAFTGAVRDRVGRFELAHGGTLFLDEVGEIPLEMQGKLLRVLQEGTFERVGDETTKSVDARIVAATNRDLTAEVKAGRFREDLFYRLEVFPIEVAPLRERPEDIPILAVHFLERHSIRMGLAVPRFTRRHAQQLQRYDWPGNVRELQNVVERAVIRSRTGPLTFDAPTSTPVARGKGAETPTVRTSGKLLNEAEMKEFERANLLGVLERAGWKISGEGGAAEFLGLHPATLTSRLRAMGITRTR